MSAGGTEMAHYSLGPVQVDTGRSDRRAWFDLGPATYGEDTVGFSIATPGRYVALTWLPALDRIRRADYARYIREAAKEQAVAARRMMYAQRCAV